MSPSPSDSLDHSVPEQWAEAVVLESVHCRKCGYDLRGLRADSRCPECGFDIWPSIEHTVDPTASQLPSIRNPKAVGNSLVVLIACMLAGLLLTLWPSVFEMLRGRGRSATQIWSLNMYANLWFGAAIIVSVGLWAVRALAPPRGAEPAGAVWRDITRIAVGFVIAVISGCLWVQFTASPGLTGVRQRLAIHLAAVVFATISLMGLRGVFHVIGYRSREYRRSQGGRQNLELIIAALVAGFIGNSLHYLCRTGILPRDWMMMSRLMIWASHIMVLIGLAYLVMNAWWIRRALRKPPPAMDQVLAPVLPPDTWIPDREE